MLRPGLLASLTFLACAACATPTATAAPLAAPRPTSPPAVRTPPRPAPEAPPRAAPDDSLRGRVVERAASAIGAPRLSRITREVSDDCTGFVRWAYRASGEDLVEGSAGTMLSIASRARALRRGGRPQPGDLVFFRETYDRDSDRRRDDGITHVGVVERVEPDGTVVFAHRASTGVKESRMNLRFPSKPKASDGHVLNDYIRRGSAKRRGKLTGEQFAGYADLEQLYRSRAGGGAALARVPAPRGR